MWKLSDWLSVAPFKCVSYFKVDELTGGQVNELLVDRGNKRQSNKWTCFKWTSRRVSQLHGDRGNKRQSNKWTCFKWTSRRVSQLHGDRGNKRQSNKWTCFKWTSRRVSQLLVDGVNKRQSNRWTCFKWRVFECTGQQVDKQLVNLLTHNSSTIISVSSPTFGSLSVSVCKKEICSFCSSVSSVRECCDRVAFCFIFSQIAQINRVHRTHRNLKVMDNTER